MYYVCGMKRAVIEAGGRWWERETVHAGERPAGDLTPVVLDHTRYYVTIIKRAMEKIGYYTQVFLRQNRA